MKSHSQAITVLYSMIPVVSRLVARMNSIIHRATCQGAEDGKSPACNMVQAYAALLFDAHSNVIHDRYCIPMSEHCRPITVKPSSPSVALKVVGDNTIMMVID